MFNNCFVLPTSLCPVQDVEKGIVRFLDTKRVGSNDRKYLFEASAVLCRNAVVDKHPYEERFLWRQAAPKFLCDPQMSNAVLRDRAMRK